MLFDSHAHLDDEAFSSDRYEIIEALNKNGVGNFINVGSTMASSEFSLTLAEKYPFIYAAVGVHPSECEYMTDGDLLKIEKWLSHEKCVALGEIGRDYHYEGSTKEKQRYWFERQCELAKKLDKPVIIHDREAHEECFDMVKKHGNRGVFHCFSSSAEMALRLYEIGFYISFTGVLTFKNSKKAVEAAREMPLDKILIETDCPYMAPEPVRGTRNEPKNVIRVAEKLAEIKGISVEEAIQKTAENTRRLFGIGDK